MKLPTESRSLAVAWSCIERISLIIVAANRLHNTGYDANSGKYIQRQIIPNRSSMNEQHAVRKSLTVLASDYKR